MSIPSTTEMAFDDTSGLLLSKPDQIFVPSYIAALEEGMRPCRHKNKQDEIDNLRKADPVTWAMFAETCPNSVGTDNFCMEDMFWLTKQDVFIGYIMLRTEMGSQRTQFGGNTGREFRPSEQNKGYGTIGLALTKAIATKRGYDHLEMVTSHDNIAAIRPWQKCGAELVETIDNPPKSYYPGAAVKYRIALERSAG